MTFTENNEHQTAAPHVFISYWHGDRALALDICQGLQSRYNVFIDQQIHVGAEWAKEINRQLEQADFVVVLLSEQSILSEMVVGEIEKARDLAGERGTRRPRILPVRVAYEGQLPYPLSAYCRPLQWVTWRSHNDTQTVIQRLLQGIQQEQEIERGGHSGAGTWAGPDPKPIPTPRMVLPPSWPVPRGALSMDSSYYIERPADRHAWEEIDKQGVTISIRGPRKVGKTSLLIRVIDAARRQHRQIVWIDFQLFEKSALADSRKFYQQFCGRIGEVLDPDQKIGLDWKDVLGDTFNCERYMERMLKEKGPFVLAMDDVDRVFDSPFHSDFFSMLRNWHDKRASDRLRYNNAGNATWKNLDIVLVASTEPHLWITDGERSPFSVAVRIPLDDFTPEHVRDLNRRYESPLREDELDRLVALVSGHPYLVHYAIYTIYRGTYTAEQLFEQARSDDGPFADHLNHLLFKLHGKPDLSHGLKTIIDTKRCHDDDIYYRLNSAGLVCKGKRHGDVLPSRQLYADFFSSRLKSGRSRWPFFWQR